MIASSGDLYLPLVILCGALGAFLGDNTVYFIGRRWGDSVKRRFFSSEKAKERMAWADRQLDERGGELIVVARFIPGGRTAVCLSAGGLEMPWRRFATFDAIAAIVWASYAALLGYVGGKQFEEAPWKGLALALLIAFSIAGAVELVRWLMRRRKEAARTGSRRRRAPTCASTRTTRSTGTRGARRRSRARARRPADPPLHRLRRVPLVPRDGARVLRGRGDGAR